MTVVRSGSVESSCTVCVHVCVCVRQRERDKEKEMEKSVSLPNKAPYQPQRTRVYMCVKERHSVKVYGCEGV